MDNKNHSNKARPYGFARKVRMEFQILSFDMLKNLRRASVLVFTRRRTLNPKTLWSSTLKPCKTLHPKTICFSHVRRQGILNVAVQANHGVCE